MKRLVLLAALALALLPSAPALAQSELRIGLQDDPDTLDPATNWSFVGRHVLQSPCDKLVDIDEQGKIVPMLATAWSWSEDGRALTLKLRPNLVFHDGERLDAEAVRYNLERALTMKGPRRRAEIEVIERIEAVDPATVRLHLKEPSVPLLAALTDRAGMIVSPKAAEAAGANFTRQPVCSGPYKFVEHRAQDRIVLERFKEHWRAAAYAFRPPRLSRPARLERAPVEPALGPARPHRAHLADRHRRRRGGQDPAGRRRPEPRLFRRHLQHRERIRERSRPKPGAARGLRPRDRPGGHQRGRLRGALRGRQPALPALEPVLRQGASGEAARRRGRQGETERGRLRQCRDRAPRPDRPAAPAGRADPAGHGGRGRHQARGEGDRADDHPRPGEAGQVPGPSRR